MWNISKTAESIRLVSVLCCLGFVVLLVQLCKLFVHLGVLADCGEGVKCLLVGWHFCVEVGVGVLCLFVVSGG